MSEKEYIFDEDCFIRFYKTKMDIFPDRATVIFFKALSGEIIEAFRQAEKGSKIEDFAPYLRLK